MLLVWAVGGDQKATLYMMDHPRSLKELIERARGHAGLRDHRGSFDSDVEDLGLVDYTGSARGEWWPFIRLAVMWADCFPGWTSDDWIGPGGNSL